MKFKVGQKVRMVIGYGDARKGDIGIVRGVPEALHQYAVEFPCFNKYNCGHNCGGLIPSKNGYWIEEDYMELASEQIDVKEDDFIAEPSSVTIISTSGEEKHIRAVVTKKDNNYIIKETRIPNVS